MTHLKPNYPELLAILEPRTYWRELQGFRGGQFSPDRTKFIANTFTRFDSVEYEDYQPIFQDQGHGSVGADRERSKKWLDEESYQMKTTDECVAEGIYWAWTIRFSGIFYESEWFIQQEIIFWGEHIDEAGAMAWLDRRVEDSEFWKTGSFGPPRTVSVPNAPQIRHIDEEEFAGTPSLVVYHKIEEKRKIIRAFEQYMNASLVAPFLQKMRIRFPTEFVDFIGLFRDYTLLYPRERTHFLVVAMSKHQEKGYRLVWFLYDPSLARFYRWTYPQPRYSAGSYAYTEELITDLKDISEWNDSNFLLSCRTLDDPKFWAEYVWAKEDGRYRWLAPIEGL